MGAGAAAGMAGIIGGVAGHIQGFLGEMTPAAMAQRREAGKAMRRLNGLDGTGVYGLDQAEKNQMRSEASAATQAQMAGLQAQLARQQAGGAATEQSRALGQAAMGAAAQNEASIQQASNAAAQTEYNRDVQMVDDQAARGRKMWQDQANISMQTTGAGDGNASQVQMPDLQKRVKETGGTQYPSAAAAGASAGVKGP